MTRIIATLLGAMIGGLIGLIYSPMAAAIGAVAMGLIALVFGGATGLKISRGDAKTIRQGIDMGIILFWASSPALKRFMKMNDPERYLEKERFLYSMCIPLEIDYQISSRRDIVRLFRDSAIMGTEPYAALKRHNRAFKPGMFRKKSASYTILTELARILVAAGSDRRGIIWYFHVASCLKIKPNVAAEFLPSAIDEQFELLRILSGFPPDDSPLGRAHEGIKVDDNILPILDWFETKRSEIVDIMFGSSSEAA